MHGKKENGEKTGLTHARKGYGTSTQKPAAAESEKKQETSFNKEESSWSWLSPAMWFSNGAATIKQAVVNERIEGYQSIDNGNNNK